MIVIYFYVAIIADPSYYIIKDGETYEN